MSDDPARLDTLSTAGLDPIGRGSRIRWGDDGVGRRFPSMRTSSSEAERAGDATALDDGCPPL